MAKETTKYDFMAMGQAIKEARKKRGWTREHLALVVDLAPRYIMSLENKGQHYIVMEATAKGLKAAKEARK